jgi:hypothetical protein
MIVAAYRTASMKITTQEFLTLSLLLSDGKADYTKKLLTIKNGFTN